MTKRGAVAAGAIALVAIGGGWLGATAWSSHSAESALKALVQSTATSSLRVTKLEHRAGFMQSTGRAEVALIDRCGRIGGSREGLVAVAIEYRMSHAVTPTSLARFDWTMQPAGALAATFGKAFVDASRLSGAGTVDLAGGVESSLALPAIRWVGDGGTLDASASSGRIAFGAKDLRITWNTDRLVARMHGRSMEVQAVAFDAHATDRVRGLGTTSVSIGRIETAGGSVVGLRLASDVVERGDRIDADFRPELKSATFAGESVSDLALHFGVHGLHGASVDAIGKLLEGTCDVANLTDEEAGKLAGALRTILVEGFTVGIPKLGGTVGAGRVSGKFDVDIAKGSGGTVAIADRLQSSGEIRLSGDVLTPEHKALAVGVLGAVEGAEGLSLGYAFSRGKLFVNDRPVEARALTRALRMVDAQVAGFLLAPQRLVALARASRAAPVAPSPAATDEDGAAEADDAARPTVETLAGRLPRE